MRRFFLDIEGDELPQTGQVVTLGSEESHHMATVLRGGREKSIELIDGRGHRFSAQVVKPNRRAVEVEILSVTRDEEESRPPLLILACAVVKGKRFEWALEKAAELGVHKIQPVITEHGVIEPGAGKQQRWQTILRSALKQCGRSWLPDLAEPLSLEQWLTAGSGSGPVFFGAVPYEVADCPSWTDWLNQGPDSLPSAMSIAVGPEGGWTSKEISQLVEHGAHAINLGPHVLRAETAAVAGLTALQSLRGVWQGEASG